jgi:hypothetical protein
MIQKSCLKSWILASKYVTHGHLKFLTSLGLAFRPILKEEGVLLGQDCIFRVGFGCPPPYEYHYPLDYWWILKMRRKTGFPIINSK